VIKVYFQASSILASYNLDLPKAMSSDMHIYVDIEHPLLYVLYLYERLHGRYGGFKVIPPYIDIFMKFHVIKKTDVVHLNSLNANLAKIAKKLGKSVVAVLHVAPFPKEAYDTINDYIDVSLVSSAHRPDIYKAQSLCKCCCVEGLRLLQLLVKSC
jgi:hypothetical protein